MEDTNHRSTSRVLDILDLLAENTAGMTLTELSKAIDAPKSSLFPILHTMKNRNYLFFNVATAKYFIGHQTHLVGGTYQNRSVVFEYIKRQMDHIRDTCGETCNLGILNHEQASYIAVSEPESENCQCLTHTAGMQFPAYCSGIGKALLLDYSIEELRALYPDPLVQYTPNTVTSVEILYAQLLMYQKEGFTYETSEARDNIFCIAIPLCNESKIIAALSVSIPLDRMTESKVSMIKRAFLETKPLIDSYLHLFHLEDGHDLLS